MTNMTETSDRYRRLATDMTEAIQRVPDERWADTSPCPDWTAHDVLQHLMDTHGKFMGFVGRSLPAGPSVDDDPEPAGAEFDGASGRTTFAKAVDRFICLDLVIHRWDLARATDQDAIIDPSELERIWQDVDSFADKMRGPGAFGEAIEPRPDASPQDRLLAFLGRQT
jgi:uncharacterized protein (TIGR03083 family)